MCRIRHIALRTQRQPREHQPETERGGGGEIPGQVDAAGPHLLHDSAWPGVEFIVEWARRALIGVAEQENAQPAFPALHAPPHELARDEQPLERLGRSEARRVGNECGSPYKSLLSTTN